jgi:UDP-2-acetamido-3-amino-2,3-dideoxy-glucuronate N-acetyltransferase
VSEYGHRLNFDEKGIAICPETAQQYELKDKEVKRKS